MTKYTQEELDAKIAEALETETKGLKTKNKELIDGLKDAKKDLQELTAEKEAALAEAIAKSGDITKITEQLKTQFQKQIDLAVTGKTEAEKKLNTILVDKGLLEELNKAKIAPHLIDAAAALILKNNKAEVIEVDGVPTAQIGGKAIGSFIKDWSQGDNGKNFVAAGNNGGGAAQGGTGKDANSKQMKQSEFNALNAVQRAAEMASGTTLLPD